MRGWSALFPGQGSQHPGMGRFLFDEFSSVRQLFEEASDTLHIKFRALCFDGSETDLAKTENTQPCLLLVSTAAARVLKQEFDFVPEAAAGHSVGEYAAVVQAGALSFVDAMRAVRQRGQAMQSAVPMGQGGMTAVIGLGLDQVQTLCRWGEKAAGLSPIEVANINAPGQIVISGNKQLLDWIPLHFSSEIFATPPPRVKFIPLKVSAPFHCAMMNPAQEVMASVLEAMHFSTADFPIVQNVNALPTRGPDELRQNLIQQVSAPVRWVECVQKLTAMGAVKAIEVGCGKVLTGLVKKIDSTALETFNINSLDDLKVVAKQLRCDS